MAEEKMFFFIADISGYTKYMINNQMTADHGEITIHSLIESLVKQVKMPLEISKLEGDAVFLYMPAKKLDPFWVCKKIFALFQVFDKKIRELVQSNLCKCGACASIDQLNLKIISHYGEASFQKIGRFHELSGLDVIILHRLLKNHVPSSRYFLLTEPAYQNIPLPDDVKISKGEEHYDDVGTIPIYVCDPPRLSEEDFRNYNTFFYKMKREYAMMKGGMLKRLGLKPKKRYHNFPASFQ